MRPGRCGALSALLVLAIAVSCGPRTEYHGIVSEPPVQLTDVPFEGVAPQPLSLAHPDGRVTLLAFGYTTCPDVCPTTLSDWRRVRHELGTEAARARFVFVSVDWRNVKPEWVAQYARNFDPSFIGVTADSLSIFKLLPLFKAEAEYEQVPGGAGSTVSHTDFIYLIDGTGRLRVTSRIGSSAHDMASDMRRMLHAAPAP